MLIEDMERLERLVTDLEQGEPLSSEQERKLRPKIDYFAPNETQSAQMARLRAMHAPQVALPDALQVLNAGDNEAKRQFQQSLEAQLDVLEECIGLYWDYGEAPPPHFAERTAIILSKMKRKDLERRFLGAYVSHFCQGQGTAEARLRARLQKVT